MTEAMTKAQLKAAYDKLVAANFNPVERNRTLQDDHDKEVNRIRKVHDLRIAERDDVIRKLEGEVTVQQKRADTLSKQQHGSMIKIDTLWQVIDTLSGRAS